MNERHGGRNACSGENGQILEELFCVTEIRVISAKVIFVNTLLALHLTGSPGFYRLKWLCVVFTESRM